MNWKLIRHIDYCVGIPIINLQSMLHANKHATLPDYPERILLVKFWGIGNIFMMLPSIQALRAAFPYAEIDFLTLESNREALLALDIVHNIITIDTGSYPKFISTWREAVKPLAQRGYELAIDFEQFARFSVLVTMQARAAATIGFATKGQHRHHLYSSPVEYDNHIHVTRSFFSLVARAGVTAPFTPNITLHTSTTLHSNGNCLLNNLGISSTLPVAILHIGTSENFRERRWPPERFAELAELLRDKSGFQILLTGLPDVAHLIRDTWEHLSSYARIYDLGGKLPFSDYFALISTADLVISADTASVHLASALKISVVGLYGPNTPTLYGPWGERSLAISAKTTCSPCITNFNGKINNCRHPDGRGACMQAITVEQVYSEIEKTYLLPDSPWRITKASGPRA